MTNNHWMLLLRGASDVLAALLAGLFIYTQLGWIVATAFAVYYVTIVTTTNNIAVQMFEDGEFDE
jgi:hypothetical protein